MDSKGSPHKLILFSGLPGAGKTSLAQALAKRLKYPLFAKDRLQSQLRALGLTGRVGKEGYELILDLAEQQLALGVGAILDGVFPLEGYRKDAATIAETHGAEFRVIYCFCSDEQLWQERMQNRRQYVPHWSPVGWDEVLKIRAYFAPWDNDKALFLDAINDFEDNLQQALKWVTDQ